MTTCDREAATGCLWDVPDLGDDFRTPIVTSLRTLFVSGTVDSNTPPFQAEEMRSGFSDAQHLSIDCAGHEDWQRIPAVLIGIRQFLAERPSRACAWHCRHHGSYPSKGSLPGRRTRVGRQG